MKPKALLYNPGLHVLGGGERYTFALARVLADTHDVTVAGTQLPDADAMARLGFDTDAALRVIPFDGVTAATEGIDLFVDVVTKPPPRSRARRSFLVVQFPFEPRPALRSRPRAWWRTRGRWPYTCLVYSEFVRRWVAQRWRQPAHLLPPPVDVGQHEDRAKDALILSVGRFHPVNHHKRHDVLLDAYAALPDDVRAGWRLVVAGAAILDDEGRRVVDALEERARACGAEVHVNVPQDDLRDLLRRAALFWHAAGYGRPADRPELAEHFGIATVEAMSYGAVPLVHGDGGQPEIVVDGTGVVWHDLPTLVARTAALARDEAARRVIAARAADAAAAFDFDHFAERARDLLGLRSPA